MCNMYEIGFQLHPALLLLLEPFLCLQDTPPCDLLSPVLDQVVRDAGIEKRMVNDICVGNCNQPAAGAARSRTAQFYAYVSASQTCTS